MKINYATNKSLASNDASNQQRGHKKSKLGIQNISENKQTDKMQRKNRNDICRTDDRISR